MKKVKWIKNKVLNKIKLERSVMNWIKYSQIMKLKLVIKKFNNWMTKSRKKKMIKDSVLQIVIIREN